MKKTSYIEYKLDDEIGAMIFSDLYEDSYELIVFLFLEFYQTQRQFFNYFALVLFFYYNDWINLYLDGF